MIKDQRHMSGMMLRETREDVEAFWHEFADERNQRGFPPFEHAPGRADFHRSKQTLHAYISDSRWVADCTGGPTGKCAGGIACWPEHENGCCLDCGTIYKIEFPETATLHEGVEALMVRPTGNRNWKPREETPEQLRHENIQHGYMPRGAPDWKTELAAEYGVPVEMVDDILSSAERRAKP